MLDVVSANESFDIKQYSEKVNEIIATLFEQKKLPIIVGGTGFYIKGVLEGFDNLTNPVDLSLRQSLNQLSLEEIQERLQKLNPSLWLDLNNSEKSNKRRLIRHIEIYLAKDQIVSQSKKINTNEYDVLKIGLKAPKEILDKRIDERVDKRIDQGMIEESKNLIEEGISLERLDQLGLEYRYLAKLLSGEIDEKMFRILLKTKIHQYAKRQMTWFKKDEQIHWVDITKTSYYTEVEKLVLSWYNQEKKL
jgi:tRNA dimethylallyltransferase